MLCCCCINLWQPVSSGSACSRRSPAAVTADAVGCGSGTGSVPPTAHRAVAALSACATSATTSAIWLGSKQQPAAPPVPSLSAVGGAVSSQLQALRRSLRPRRGRLKGCCWWMCWWLHCYWVDWRLPWTQG